MENAGIGRGQTTPESAHQHSSRTAASKFACNTGEAAESQPVAVEDKIFSVDSGRSQNSDPSSSPNDGTSSISRTAVVDDDDISEVGSNMHLSTDNSYDHISPTPHDLVCSVCYC